MRRYAVDQASLSYVAALYRNCGTDGCRGSGDIDLNPSWQFCPYCGDPLRETRVTLTSMSP